MPSLAHEALVDMFRDNPALIVDLLRAIHIVIPQYAAIKLADAALGEIKPTTLAADLVLELCDAAGDPVLAVVLEVQLEPVKKKRDTWPAYLTTHRARRGCDTCLLVLTPSRSVAAWAREPIRLGPGNPEFRVLAIGPDEAPVVTDSAVAIANPMLAFLSALTHGDEADGLTILTAALDALAVVDKATSHVYLQLIKRALSAPRRHSFQEMIMVRDLHHLLPVPNFAEKMRARVAAVHPEAGGLLVYLHDRGFKWTHEQFLTIERCHDLEIIEHWKQRALIATTTAELLGDFDPHAGTQ